jgi:hypothetical protein
VRQAYLKRHWTPHGGKYGLVQILQAEHVTPRDEAWWRYRRWVQRWLETCDRGGR